MSESGELYTTVNYIKNKVDALEKIEMLNFVQIKNYVMNMYLY